MGNNWGGEDEEKLIGRGFFCRGPDKKKVKKLKHSLLKLVAAVSHWN